MKRIITILIGLLLLASIAMAGIPSPHPVVGAITSEGYPVENLEIRYENTVTKKQSTTFTNENGRYQFELGNFDQDYRDSDVIKISMVYCESLSRCTQSTIVGEGGHTEVSFDMGTGKLEVPTVPDTATIVQYICWDGTPVSSQVNCPTRIICWNGVEVHSQSECSAEPVTCADGTTVDDESDCLESNDSWWYWIVGIISAFLASAGGWKFYNGKFKHYHRGLNSYHDPDAKHRNAKYSHTRWSESALKCIGDVTKIQKGIDLSK